jgi:hypothetical protein
LFVFTPEGWQMQGSAQLIYLLFDIFCVHLVLVGVVYHQCDFHKLLPGTSLDFILPV